MQIRVAFRFFGVGLLFTLLGSGVLIAFLHYQDMRVANDHVRAGRKVTDTARGSTEYGERGEGFPVLVIHGAGGGYDQGLWIGELFFGEGYRIIAPSRFGYLGAPIPLEPSIELQAEVYASLLDALGIKRTVVLGFSAGGPSALQFALRHPHRTIALIMASAVSYTEPLSDAGRRRLESRINRIIGSDFFYWAIEKAAPAEFLTIIGVPKVVQRALKQEDLSIAFQTLELMHPMSQRFPGILLDQTRHVPRDWPLHRISAPTLVIHARDDTLVPYPNGEYTLNAIPTAGLLSFETGGHLLLGHRKVIRDTIDRFLTKIVSFY